jgi:hypothetical protein
MNGKLKMKMVKETTRAIGKLMAGGANHRTAWVVMGTTRNKPGILPTRYNVSRTQ